MSQVSLGRPEFVPGTPPGHPTAKFLYVIFLYRFFLSVDKYFSGGSCAHSTQFVMKVLRCRDLSGHSHGQLSLDLSGIDFFRAVRLRFGHGFESCDANAHETAKTQILRCDAPYLPQGPKSPKNQNRSKMGQK